MLVVGFFKTLLVDVQENLVNQFVGELNKQKASQVTAGAVIKSKKRETRAAFSS